MELCKCFAVPAEVREYLQTIFKAESLDKLPAQAVPLDVLPFVPPRACRSCVHACRRRLRRRWSRRGRFCFLVGHGRAARRRSSGRYMDV